MGKPRGFFAVGVYHPKTENNIGTLFRSAQAFGASFVFTVGSRYKPQSSDTGKSYRSVPLFHFASIDDLIAHLPYACPLAAVEIDGDSVDLKHFHHEERMCYMLGAEDHGLPPEVLSRCHKRVFIPHADRCLNVAVAGSIVLYDRRRQTERTRNDP